MTRRRGLSLTEVLVALFLMAIGLIGILTMFPLGALQMGQALKDDRTAQAAGQADGYMRWYWRHQLVDVLQGGGTVTEPFYQAFSNPNDPTFVPLAYQQPYPANPLIPLLTAPGTDPVNVPQWTRTDVESGPSYPVVIDPMGWFARGGYQGGGTQDQFWVGKDAATGALFGKLARRSLNQIMTAAQSQRTCSMLDGITYLPYGTPDLSVGNAVQHVAQRLHARHDHAVRGGNNLISPSEPGDRQVDQNQLIPQRCEIEQGIKRRHIQLANVP